MNQSTTRLSLENLEDRCLPANLVAVFPGHPGLFYRADGTASWTRISGNTPAQVEVNKYGEVLADFQSQGAWYYHRTSGWVRLTTWNPSDIALGSNHNPTNEHVNSDIFMTFPGWGLMRISRQSPTTNSVTQRLTAAVPSQIDAALHSLAADFDSNGLWVWSPWQNWAKLSGSNPSDIALGESRGSSVGLREATFYGSYTLAADFDGHGLWALTGSSSYSSFSIDGFEGTPEGESNPTFTGGNWKQLTSVNPYDIDVTANGTIAAAFNGYGLYSTTVGGSWRQLTSYHVGSVSAATDGGIYATFPGFHNGWQSNSGGGWSIVNGFVPNRYGVA